MVDHIKQAASAIKNAKALLITTGAGMGVDSGLPDYRGPEGLWKAYPPIKERGLTLPEMSTPSWFEDDPQFAWGFFGHRIKLYRTTQPHDGFEILKKWGEKMECGYFVYTSNVDGQFQKAGYDKYRIVECHGSLQFLQTINGDESIWATPEELDLVIDHKTLKAQPPLPTGPPGAPSANQMLARPNVLLFNDLWWVTDRTDKQLSRLWPWLENVRNQPLVVVEIGAGLVIPTVRHFSEETVENSTNENTRLIRINPNDPQVRRSVDIPLSMTGLEALKRIDECIKA
ncbi:NAD-dependent protein deacylase-like [Hydractinia symbiolongicarpus]|uniref:NAD-dependent protein deacylase-like n=1 Tax=Hydractinia symbiolongicarpus TaxID=13093 RepID=UPI00254F27E0|nr:NAD-dependent protein deacylase-like [Hydractinia symbiolongicarpus]XP_057300962.1 NAD-dependent protein deacylase-like [Hydractinia symbiolongicarpus]